ncbi:MAG: YgdI/YgdR family lipoprotein [Gammaproteobacteria bacterium]|nr:YgdI/YgdR family lipoprotein [Gammaproteobacteria bacterium]
MKNVLFVFLVLCVLIIAGCGKSDYLRVSSNDGGFIQLDKIDVRSMSEIEDAKGNKAILVELAETGQLKMQTFTQKNVGKSVSMNYGSVTVLKNVHIVEASAMEKFRLSVNDKDLIVKILDSYQK